MRTVGRNDLLMFMGGFLLMLGLIGCQGEPKETATKGRVTVITSESVAPVIKAEKDTFEQLYQQAHIDLETMSAREAITHLFNDSIKVIVSSRALNAEERAVAKKASLNIGEFKIAVDAVAVIVDTTNPVKQLRTTQLDSVFSGTVRDWKLLGTSKKGNIELCLPDRNSGTYEVFTTRILKGKAFATPSQVLSTSPAMVRFVSTHPNAIGLLGLNWLSLYKDSVRALAIADPDAPDSLGTKGEYFAPYQAYVYQQNYPITRTIYVYSRTDNYSPGGGFLTFITSAPGQKIILNSGLVPATMPVRIVQLTN